MCTPSPLRYPGGKQRAVKRILEIIPEGTRTLYSPFFGGGSVELAWAEANPDGKVVARDLFPPLVNFWKEVFAGKAEVIAMLVEHQFYPPERDMFYRLQEALRKDSPEVSNLTKAAWFFFINRSSFSGATLSGGMGNGDRFSTGAIDKLRKFQVPNIDFRQANSLDWLRRRTDKFTKEDAFLFLDPPYMLKNSKLYGNNGDTHEDFNHKKLASILDTLDQQGVKWVMTYNNCPEIHKLYAHYRKEPATWKYGMSTDKDGRELFVFSDNI